MQLPSNIDDLLEPAEMLKPAQKRTQSNTPDTEEVEIKDFPELPDAAMYGLAGEFTKFVTEDSEADRSAVLSSFLALAGAAFGTACYAPVGPSKHYPRLYVAVAGASSRARKGTSLDPVKLLADVMHKSHQDLDKLKINPGGLVSGEGLTFAVRDASEDKLENSDEPKDPGVKDKRLLVVESELGSPLKAMRREGNTLSSTLRAAWDSGDLEPLTKYNRIRATNAHICLIGHITIPELKLLLSQNDIYNGLGNRILWVCARRRKLVPIPKPLDKSRLEIFANKFATVLATCRHRESIGNNEIGFGQKTASLWDTAYRQITQDQLGMFGVITARAEAQVLRLSLTFALLDGASEISASHLNAALAFWSYCNESAQYLFGSGSENTDANKILEFLKSGRKSQTEIYDLFGGNKDAATYGAALTHLQAVGRIDSSEDKSKPGRPKKYWQLREDFMPT